MDKVPRKVAFFVWHSIDRLLLHCSMATDIWSRVLTLFGLTWVMLKLVFELVEYWQGYIQHHRPAKL